jgi:FlaA1/EpsC-like NDP-sugar epimerase
MDILKLINRQRLLFEADVFRHEQQLQQMVSQSKFLVIGGAGSIGQAVTREIFKRDPKILHVIDLSENNMVELVRELRSTLGYIKGDFQTFAIDCGSVEFKALMNASDGYDYVLNLSALKHVRSEKDPFTLMRMLQTNIVNSLHIYQQAAQMGAKKYFVVSTDKAANPVNMMGASKQIMEMCLMQDNYNLPISMARFANVAFSDGSLLHGFNQRFMKKQPISAPSDIQRYFITPQEAGELCLISCLLGENKEILFPKIEEELDLTNFSDIAIQYISALGFEPYQCETEDEARQRSEGLIENGQWPCFFFSSDTTGEKPFEEFFTDNEILNLEKFEAIGIIQQQCAADPKKLSTFLEQLNAIQYRGCWDKSTLVELVKTVIPNFGHQEKGKNLDSRM